MRKWYALKFVPVFLISPVPLFGQVVNVSGITRHRTEVQTGAAITKFDGFYASVFIEGEDLTSAAPISSASLTGPKGTVSIPFAEDGGRWELRSERVDSSNFAATDFPNGSYTLSAGGESASLELTTNMPFPGPVLSFDTGRWENGVYVLTALEAQGALTVQSTVSTGNGFVTLDVYGKRQDEEVAQIGFSGESGSQINHTFPGNTFAPGREYILETEFDQVVGSSPFLGASAFSLASTSCSVTLRVEPVTLLSSFIKTGSKQGRFEFETEVGVDYFLIRSVDFIEQNELEKLVGNGARGTISFDDSGSPDAMAFFWVASRPGVGNSLDGSAFASQVDGKTIKGVNFTANNRWESFGITGNWSYAQQSGNEALLTLTTDDTGNDGSVERDEFTLDFGDDGDLTTVPALGIFYEDDEAEDSRIEIYDLTKNSYAPEEFTIEELFAGKAFFGGQYRFTSFTRWIWNNSEPGNWSFTYLDENRVSVLLTYDDEANNPAFYREEIVLSFNGTSTVPYTFAEYDSGALINSSTGTLSLSAD
ncbi:MAG: hypothetical protein ACSHYF_18440 [Verrucomicrobiaceae bacterium]